MLSPLRVAAELESRRSSFNQFGARLDEQIRTFREVLARVTDEGKEELREALAHVARSGALPTDERQEGQPFVRPFEHRFSNHVEARLWAKEVLQGVTTFAVDGSQIIPSEDYSLPVGAIQVGWFENPHQPGAPYEKNIAFELILPEDTAGEDEFSMENEVNARRFELECKTLTDYMARREHAQPAPICIFDGSLVVSFAAHLLPDLAMRYVKAIRNLLEASEETRVPVVGYVDNSQAKDLAWMLHWLAPACPRPAVADGAILSGLMQWGDRSEALSCARDDRLFERLPPSLDYYEQVHFCHLRTALSGLPARLELPSWVTEEGLVDRVVDVIRAECVVGVGYPYAVETADAVAVITAQDRERFYGIVQRFAQGLDIDLRYARKAYSKRQRR